MPYSSGVSAATYQQIVDYLATQKYITKYRLEWEFWLTSRQAAQTLTQLQNDGVIGPPYVDDQLSIIHHDVLSNNKTVHASSRLRLWGYKVQTVYDFCQFLWFMLKDKLYGRERLLDVVTGAFRQEASRLGLEYRVSDNQVKADGSYQAAAELKQPAPPETVKQFAVGVSKNLLQKSPYFEVTSSKNSINVRYLDSSNSGKPIWLTA